MPEIVPERDRLGQIFVEREAARNGARDLRNVDGVREPRAEMVAFGRKKDLRLVFQAQKGLGINEAVAVALEVGAGMLMCVMVTFQSEAFRRQQSFPTHDFFVHSFSPL